MDIGTGRQASEPIRVRVPTHTERNAEREHKGIRKHQLIFGSRPAVNHTRFESRITVCTGKIEGKDTDPPKSKEDEGEEEKKNR